MARVQFNADECDQNFQIEDGIRQTLSSNPVASMDVSVMESSYHALDPHGREIPTATVDDKCQQIAKTLGVQFSIRESLVILWTKRSASCHIGPPGQFRHPIG